jgi:hypothetical protein
VTRPQLDGQRSLAADLPGHGEIGRGLITAVGREHVDRVVQLLASLRVSKGADSVGVGGEEVSHAEERVDLALLLLVHAALLEKDGGPLVSGGGALVLGGAVRNSIVAALHCVGTARIARVDALIGSAERLVVSDRSLVRPACRTEADGSSPGRGGRCPNPMWRSRVERGPWSGSRFPWPG